MLITRRPLRHQHVVLPVNRLLVDGAVARMATSSLSVVVPVSPAARETHSRCTRRRSTRLSTHAHSCTLARPGLLLLLARRQVRFSPSARASRRRYDVDDACAPPPIHPFLSGHFRGAFEAATLPSLATADRQHRRREGEGGRSGRVRVIITRENERAC